MARLDALQVRVLELLSCVEPRWVLFGGGALLAAHAEHRSTRDVDLLWPEREQLGEVPRAVVSVLRAADLKVDVVQSSPSFERLRVTDGASTLIVDLVSSPDATPLDLQEVTVGRATVRIPGRQRLLADKLCALLSRAEVRDLQDVRELLRLGADLDDGLRRSGHLAGGFSPLTLAWVLRGLPVAGLARSVGLDDADARALDAFRGELVDRLAASVVER